MPPDNLDWTNPTAVRQWAHALLTQARDTIAAGEDATRPPAHRELGRQAARRIITEAERAIGVLIDAAGLERDPR